VTDDYRGLIAERVEQTRGRITARRLLRLLRAAGYEGSERFPALAMGLASNLEQLGEVPRKLLFDNPKTVTLRDVAGAAVLNPGAGAAGRPLPLLAPDDGPSTTRRRRARSRLWCASPSRT
jgi:hypothetical protein